MDTIYYGGPIITMENRDDCPEAVLVENGFIKKVGTRVRRWTQPEIV